MTVVPPPPTVGVVLPVHDGARHLERAVGSVLAQDLSPRAGDAASSRGAVAGLDVVIVDDGSHDDSVRVAHRLAGDDPRVRVLELGRNGGVAAARNAGVAAVGGDLLAFLDQDDVWTPDRLRRGVAALAADPMLGFVTARQRFMAPEGRVPGWVRPGLLDGDLAGNVLGTVLCRRHVWERLGGLDPGLQRGFDDVDWFARARRDRIPTRELPEVLLLRGLHDGNASARTDGVHAELLAVVRRHARDRAVGA